MAFHSSLWFSIEIVRSRTKSNQALELIERQGMLNLSQQQSHFPQFLLSNCIFDKNPALHVFPWWYSIFQVSTGSVIIAQCYGKAKWDSLFVAVINCIIIRYHDTSSYLCAGIVLSTDYSFELIFTVKEQNQILLFAICNIYDTKNVIMIVVCLHDWCHTQKVKIRLVTRIRYDVLLAFWTLSDGSNAYLDDVRR